MLILRNLKFLNFFFGKYFNKNTNHNFQIYINFEITTFNYGLSVSFESSTK